MRGLISVIIMAAGRGERFGGAKQFFSLRGKTIARTSCDLFFGFKEVDQVIAVYPRDLSKERARKLGGFSNETELVGGGKLREQSVERGLEKVKNKYVLIHDAARPLCPPQVIERVIKETCRKGSAVPAVSPSSSVKCMLDGEIRSVDREKVFLIQTPQGYLTEDIRMAYRKRKKKVYTDSSSLAQEAGININLVPGDRKNIKITDRSDYEKICRMKGGLE